MCILLSLREKSSLKEIFTQRKIISSEPEALGDGNSEPEPVSNFTNVTSGAI